MNGIKYLPFENYTITSPLPVDEIRKIIAENIEPKKSFRFLLSQNNYSRLYHGKITGNRFTMRRNIYYQNSFLPVITGCFGSYLSETFIKIKMRPSFSTIIFMSFWLGVVGLIFLLLLMAELFKAKGIVQDNFLLGIATTFILFLFGWSLSYFGFKYESKKSKAFLSELLEGQEVKSNEDSFMYFI